MISYPLPRGKLVEAGVGYSAAAISLVLHSRNPNLPTFRSDIRYFQCEVENMMNSCTYFFPAGIDTYITQRLKTKKSEHFYANCYFSCAFFKTNQYNNLGPPRVGRGRG